EEGSPCVGTMFKKKKIYDWEMPYVFVDEAPFEYVRRRRGIISMVSSGEAKVIQSKQRRYKRPQEPMIKAMLKQGLVLQNKLSAATKLTRAALAKRYGIAPSMLS